MNNGKHSSELFAIDGKHTESQLFDLKNDPWELNNLARSETYSDKLNEMRLKLFKLRDEWDDESTPLGQTF